jgi:hypothetical protein
MLCAIGLGAAGCAGGAATDDAGLREAERYAERRAGSATDRGRVDTDRPGARAAAAIAADVLAPGGVGFVVGDDELAPALTEAAGAIVLEEAVLGRLLEQRCRRLGVEIDDTAIERERALAIDAVRLADTTRRLSDEEAARRWRGVLARRGLGPDRYDAFLRRNAMLRALVAQDVTVGEAQLRLAYEMRYGERYEARLITTGSAAEARTAMERLEAGERFADVAGEVSTDASALFGGVIAPISPADPGVPEAVRRAAVGAGQRGELGQAMGPIRLDTGYAVIVIDAVIEAGGPPFAEVRDNLAQLVRLRQERLLMDRLAQDLLSGVEVRPRGPHWSWAWENRPQR